MATFGLHTSPVAIYWGELERAPHRRVGLGFCHSRGIGGPTAIFEPAPFLQPCTFFWPDLVDRKPPHAHRAAHNAHTDAQYKATEPRRARIPMQGPLTCISGQQKVHGVRSDRVSFQSRTRSTSTSRKYSTRLNVNIVARSTLMRAFSDAQCSSKARLSSTKYMTSSQIGFLHALNMYMYMPWV